MRLSQGVSQDVEEENVACLKDRKHIDDALDSITVRISAFLCLLLHPTIVVSLWLKCP